VNTQIEEVRKQHNTALERTLQEQNSDTKMGEREQKGENKTQLSGKTDTHEERKAMMTDDDMDTTASSQMPATVLGPGTQRVRIWICARHMFLLEFRIDAFEWNLGWAG
jgi:hypothetical protein